MLGLTARQLKVFSRHWQGETHEQIGERFGMTRQAVTEMIRRARQRNPNLPRPSRTNRRRHKQLSQLPQLRD
jgi:transcriptional regulator